MSEQQQFGSAGKVLQLFEQGKRFTEELLKENEKLRMMITSLRAEKQELESQYVKVDVPRLREKVELLEREVQKLRRDNEELRDQFVSVEEENREFADRYVEVERQNSDLVHLYVASYRLHSTLDYGEVITIIKEIVINMLGSEVFGIYVINEAEQQLVLLAHEGMEDFALQSIPLDDDIVGKAATSGEVYTEPEGSNGGGDRRAPKAGIPLRVGERALGVIVIYEFLPQKHGLQPVDFELFELLGGHAATAVYVSKLYAASERKRTTLQGFLELLKNDSKCQTGHS